MQFTFKSEKRFRLAGIKGANPKYITFFLFNFYSQIQLIVFYRIKQSEKLNMMRMFYFQISWQQMA